MTSNECTGPVSSEEIADYWAGELGIREVERIEEHVFTCAACAADLAHGEAVASGIRRLVRAGAFHAPVPETVLNRLAREGVRVRTYALAPGDVVPCAVWDDDELVVTRLRGDFSGAEVVSVVATLATGQEISRSEGIAVRPGQYEVIDAISAEWLRQLPAATVRLRVTAARGAEERVLGEYTLAHAGRLGRD